MIKNYFNIAWRGLRANRLLSFINIAGLAVGMAVAILIGLWIWDEVSFNKSFQHHDRIVRVMQKQVIDGVVGTQRQVPVPLGDELRDNYGGDFERIVLSSDIGDHLLRRGDKTFTKPGNFMEPGAPEMLTLQMLMGSRAGLQDAHSILLSETLARTLFAGADPMNKIVRIDDTADLRVMGVYADLRNNSDFKDLSFMAPWALDIEINKGMKRAQTQWGNNPALVYGQLKDHADIHNLSAKIRHVKADKESQAGYKSTAELFLYPMADWHLYSEFRNGVNTGGRIEYVWLFGIIGVIILLLACINFMNLSTAKSEKRAKEVGIRKAIGSSRGQLIGQFFGESLFTAGLAFVFALALVWVALPFFNGLADKRMVVLTGSLAFWGLSAGFVMLTGLIAGSYPALYLSAFRPVRVLKGAFQAGRYAFVPRKVLVVVQFSVSVMLIIGTVVVYRQIQYSRNRPVGYDREGLVTAQMVTHDIHNHFLAFRQDLLQTGVVAEAAESTSPTTDPRNEEGGFNWRGKDPNSTTNFWTFGVTPEYGKTVGWKLVSGRDYSRALATDGFSFVINETAAKMMGLEHPVGEIVQWSGYKFTIIGVVRDMVMMSPYDPVQPAIFYQAPWYLPVVTIRIKPGVGGGVSEAIDRISTVFSKYAPAEPFNYKFTDTEYELKFRAEQRVGSLAAFFAGLAIFISCLGLFGMATFMAEQRTREIGVRKVLGASVFSLWRLLSREFVVLVVISACIATPAAWYFMHRWLQNYTYRAGISWWIFLVTGVGALVITLLTVSVQAIKAAGMNPVKSLRAE
jgi:putative ABC transport system permease protein